MSKMSNLKFELLLALRMLLEPMPDALHKLLLPDIQKRIDQLEESDD